MNPYPLAEDEDRFIVYLSKEYLSAAEKAKRGYICVNIDDLFAADGKYKETFIDAQQTNTYTLFPSLNKFNFNFEGGFMEVICNAKLATCLLCVWLKCI